jgi:hypothetical protein
MRLPDWFPQVPRPWNPAYREVWDAMTPNEKRWSALVDAVVVLAVLVLCLLGAGYA